MKEVSFSYPPKNMNKGLAEFLFLIYTKDWSSSNYPFSENL